MCSHKRKIQYISDVFFILSLGHAPGVGLWGAGVPMWSKKIIFKHGHVAYQIDEDDKQYRMYIYPMVKLVTLG